MENRDRDKIYPALCIPNNPGAIAQRFGMDLDRVLSVIEDHKKLDEIRWFNLLDCMGLPRESKVIYLMKSSTTPYGKIGQVKSPGRLKLRLEEINSKLMENPHLTCCGIGVPGTESDLKKRLLSCGVELIHEVFPWEVGGDLARDLVSGLPKLKVSKRNYRPRIRRSRRAPQVRRRARGRTSVLVE